MFDTLRTADLAGRIDEDTAPNIIISRAAHLSAVYLLALAQGGASPTNSPTVEWWTSSITIGRTLVDGGAFDEDTTTLTVDSTAGMQAGQALLFEATGEIATVTSVTNGTVVVIVRGAFNTTNSAFSVINNAPVRILAQPRGEGSAFGTPNMTAATKQETQVQSFRLPIEVSGLLGRTAQRAEQERGHQTGRTLDEMMVQINQSILHGSFGTETIDGKPVRMMQGLRNAITTEEAVGGTLTETAFNERLAVAFATGNGKKFGVAGATFLNTMQAIYGTRVRQGSSDVAVGVDVSHIKTVHGELELVADHSLTGLYAGDCIIIDSNNIGIRHTSQDAKGYGGLPHVIRSVDRKSDDVGQDEAVCEVCATWGDPLAHSMITGVTGAA